jgi:hypothetical protein
MKAQLFTLGFYFIFIALGCSGCGGVKKVSDSDRLLSNNKSIQEESKQVVINKDSSLEVWYDQNPQYRPVTLTRRAFGKELSFQIKPMHEGGDAWTTPWEEKIDDPKFDRYNRICQLSPTVLLYRRFPNEVAKDFYYVDQPDKLEFLDEKFKTLKTVDVWENRPYQKLANGKLTYHHFDLESAEILPYDKQKEKPHPTEFTLFTEVKAEGNHVIVNYELRSMETTKKFGSDYLLMTVVGVKHTIHIYDLQGNLKYEIKDIPSVDGAVVSNNGEYMMYTFGGIGLATANSPFATIERSGWALMRLKDRKVVYSEYTDDGKLAFGRLWIEQNLLRVAYSTPSTEIDYDYWVFYDEQSKKLFIHKLTKNQRSIMTNDYNSSPEKFRYLDYVEKFNFQQISIANK